MPDSQWDVIVVGAGPGGCAAAISAAENGGSTLLIEKQPEIGVKKPCAEAVSKETFKTAGIEPKPCVATNELSMRVYSPSEKFVDIPMTGFAINKRLFVLELAKRAHRVGAQIRVGEPVLSVEKEGAAVVGVKTPKGQYGAKVVIGADGYASTVAKSAGLDNKVELIPTFQYRFVGAKVEDLHRGDIYLGERVAPGGYLWVMPKGDETTNVGVGVRGAPPKEYLDIFIKRHEQYFGGAKKLGALGAPVPIGGMAKEIVGDGVILIGDAAGTVIPFTGAGIHSSICAGLIAGKVAMEAVSSGDLGREKLQEYVERYEEPWGRRIRGSLRGMRAFERLSDQDLDQLADILDYEDVLNLANGTNLSVTAKKLMKHPIFLAKIVKALL